MGELEMLAVATMERKRNEAGKFVNESNLGKVYGVRLPKEVQDTLETRAKEDGIAPTLLIRQIVVDWINEHESK